MIRPELLTGGIKSSSVESSSGLGATQTEKDTKSATTLRSVGCRLVKLLLLSAGNTNNWWERSANSGNANNEYNVNNNGNPGNNNNANNAYMVVADCIDCFLSCACA